MTLSLQGLRILLPRPIAQAKVWDEAIRKHGGNCIVFPTVAIEPTNDKNLAEIFSKLATCDVLIFTSTNAVLPFKKLLTTASIPTHWQLAAIGATTARAMQYLGLPVNLTSPEPYNSENLLATLQNHLSNKKRIAIIKGTGGRDLLQKNLTQQGHDVTEFAVYSRILAKHNIEPLVKVWEQGGVDYVIATSAETLNNLSIILTSKHINLLQNTNLILLSPRLSSIANNLGFTKRVLIADNASIAAILKLLGNVK